MPRPYEFEVGSVASTGAAIEIETGYLPKRVQLENATGLCSLVWNSNFNNGVGLKTITDGTMSLIAPGGITPSISSGRGFTIGTDTDINPVGGETISWIAFY